MQPINVLSLFDGISCGQLALKRARIPVHKYYASEIEPAPIACTKHNFPNTIHLGDVRGVKGQELDPIDLLIGGSPCQTVSFANPKQGNIHEGKSSLFFEYVRLLKETNPTYFLLENVRMKQKSQDVITEILGVEPLDINSSLFSCQNRRRLYWTNIPVNMNIADRCIYFRDVKDAEEDVDPDLYLKGRGLNKLASPRNRVKDIDCDKTPTLMRLQERKATDAVIFQIGKRYRYPTQREMERMQTVPDGYTACMKYNDAAAALGNGWTVAVIAYILAGMKSGKKVEKTIDKSGLFELI